MTNFELLEKMKNEFDESYLIGFHEVCKTVYDMKIERENYRKRYYIDKENVAEKDIISRIFQVGLNVPDLNKRLSSTVRFIGNIDSISSDVFNYGFWFDCFEEGSSNLYDVIVAIPDTVYLNGSKYLFGSSYEIFGSPLFKTVLPREFIYGYYIKEYCRDKDDEFKFVFSDELQFFPNLDFYNLLEDKERFWFNYLTQNGVDLSFLKSSDNIDSFNGFRIIGNNSENNTLGGPIRRLKK